MYDDTVESIEYKNYVIKIVQDQDTESPREWSNLGAMVCFHSRYNLGDEHNYDGPEELQDYLDSKEFTGVVLPLYLYDHSGITMYTTGNTDYHQHEAWDTSTVGYILADNDTIKKEYDVQRVTKQIKDKVTEGLKSEVKTYNQYLTGDVYGYQIYDSKNDEIESCYGFYGTDDCITEAKSIVDYLDKQPRKKEVALYASAYHK